MESRTHPFWGTSCVSCLNVDVFALPGAVPLVGELRAPRYQGPLGCLPGRKWGGPWASPPRNAQIPGDVNGFSFLFHVVVLVLFSACLSWVICLLGWDFVWEFSPSRLDPLLVLLFVSLSFFLCGVFAGDVLLSLSLFQPLGKPKSPSRGFGIPLIFLRHDRDHVPRPVLQAPQLHPGHLPHMFFCFRSSFALGCVRVASRGLVLRVGGLGSVCVSVGCFGWYWSCVCSSLASCLYRSH